MRIPGCKQLLCLAMFLLMAACEGEPPPPGTVAEVNGEPISLHSVQALMDSRTGSMGISPRPSLAEMRRSYAQAASILIAHTLVRQELANRGLSVSDAELDAAIERIKADYGEAGLEEFLADASLREDEWRQLVRDHLGLDIFSHRVLDPAIRISRDEIRAWYQQHEKEFKKPETWEVCLKTGESEPALQAWCDGIGESGPRPDAQCLSAFPQDVPQPWQNEFKKFSQGKCGKILQQDGQWRTAALMRKEPAKTASISEVYPLIEESIMAEKRAASFDAWLKKQLSQAQVKAMPGLFHADEEEAPTPDPAP